MMPPGAHVAESFRQFYRRSVDAILALAAAHPGQSLALSRTAACSNAPTAPRSACRLNAA
jgi:broad specificity phosphatase PhoE